MGKCDDCIYLDQDYYYCRRHAPVIVADSNSHNGYKTVFPTLVYENHSEGCGDFEQATPPQT
jgi:hypothetical protein